jgi:hypothetical protein
MQFQCIYIGSDLGLEINTSERFKISIIEKVPITVTIRMPKDDEINTGYKKDQIICISELDSQPPSNCINVFKHLLEDKKPKFITDYINSIISLHPTENISMEKLSFPLEIFPSYFKDFSNDIYAQLTDSINRVVKLFRWRYQLDKQKQNPFSAKSFCWSYDGCKWYKMPHSLRVSIETHKILTVTKSEIAVVQELANNGINEPIQNDLLLEANNSFRQGNYRSAYLIAYSSLEISIKNLISESVPEINWIISEMQSPPLQKLFSDELINVIRNEKGKVLISSLDLKSLRAKLEKLGNKRNELAHGKNVDVKSDEVIYILEFTRSITRLIDNIRGYDWSPIDTKLVKSVGK